MESWDFERKVERTNDGYWSKRETVAGGPLPVVVPTDLERPHKEAALVTGEVHEELLSDFDLCSCLFVVLGGDSLDEFSEVVFNSR